MSSPTRTERGDANRLDLRTLVIASVASAVAAIVVSRIWASGTPIAAAATPVLVTLLKEILDRPTSKIAERFTAETAALPDRQVREPVGAARARRERAATREAPSRSTPSRSMPPAAGSRPPGGADAGDIRVYRQQPSGRISRRIHPKAVLITGLLAFVIAALVITGGQVLAGHPFGSKGSGAIILGQHKAGTRATPEKDQQTTTPEQQQTTTPQNQQQTTPDKQTTTTTPSNQKPQTQSTPQAAPRTGGTPTTPATPPASP